MSMGPGPTYDPATTPADPAFHDGVGEGVPESVGSARHRQRLAAVAVGLASFAVLGLFVGQAAFTQPGGAPAGPLTAVQAMAVAASVITPAGGERRAGVAEPIAGAAKREVATVAEHRFDQSGSIAVSSRLRTEASLDAGARTATSSATAERISLFDGRIVIERGGLTASAKVARGRASGTFIVLPTTRVTIDGSVVQPTPNRQVVIAGIGTVLLNEQAIVSQAPTGDDQTGPRWRGTGALAHVRVTRDWHGVASGTQVLVGRVDAGVRQGKVRAIPQPASGVDTALVSPPSPLAPTGGGFPSLQSGHPAPGTTALPRRTTTVRADATAPSGNLQGYTFPVLGDASYTNDYGAPRAIGPHEGNDIFADEGTPIVAVADGVLDRVGWNTIGGYRFWLYDENGNGFYHAHLSAYAPLAQDGARVKAGDVIGFVGHTGNAQGTPDHLHFEIHPGNGAATNPFPYLNAWRHGSAVAIGLTTAGGDAPGRTAPLSLLGFSDITTNDGLQESVLDTVPDTGRPIDHENSPVPTDDALKDAIEGPGVTSR